MGEGPSEEAPRTTHPFLCPNKKHVAPFVIIRIASSAAAAARFVKRDSRLLAATHAQCLCNLCGHHKSTFRCVPMCCVAASPSRMSLQHLMRPWLGPAQHALGSKPCEHCEEHVAAQPLARTHSAPRLLHVMHITANSLVTAWVVRGYMAGSCAMIHAFALKCRSAYTRGSSLTPRHPEAYTVSHSMTHWGCFPGCRASRAALHLRVPLCFGGLLLMNPSHCASACIRIHAHIAARISQLCHFSRDLPQIAHVTQAATYGRSTANDAGGVHQRARRLCGCHHARQTTTATAIHTRTCDPRSIQRSAQALPWRSSTSLGQICSRDS